MPVFHIKRRIQTIKNAFKLHGLSWTIKRFTNYILAKIYLKAKHILSEKDLNKKINFSVENNLDVVDIKPHAQLLKKFCEKYDYNRERVTLLTGHFLKNDYSGFIAFYKKEFVGYIWWVDKKICSKGNMLPEIVRHEITLKDDDVYLFNFYIIPTYRGGGTVVEFLEKVHTKLNNLGYNRAMGTVVANNTPARWIYKVVGYKDINSAIFYTFFNKILYLNRMIFIKNSRKHSKYPTDYTLFYSFKKNKSTN